MLHHNPKNKKEESLRINPLQHKNNSQIGSDPQNPSPQNRTGNHQIKTTTKKTKRKNHINKKRRETHRSSSSSSDLGESRCNDMHFR
uniref:Uncharacterized protein n=1 Tax=Oryza sativa subsp. japonica TaxID=39947 RepID=Q67UW8_ORYSJ|nr:hypothetical protein [Oryza sativa Japonica Group]